MSGQTEAKRWGMRDIGGQRQRMTRSGYPPLSLPTEDRARHRRAQPMTEPVTSRSRRLLGPTAPRRRFLRPPSLRAVAEGLRRGVSE